MILLNSRECRQEVSERAQEVSQILWLLNPDCPGEVLQAAVPRQCQLLGLGQLPNGAQAGGAVQVDVEFDLQVW